MSRVMYVQFTNPGAYPPLEHSSAILAEAGAEVHVIGTTAEATAALGWPERPGVRVEIVPVRERGIGHKLDYFRYAIHVLRRIRSLRPDWLYVSDANAAPLALVARRLVRVRVLYHEHDEPYAPLASRLTRAIVRARGRLAAVADEVVVPNASRGERLRAQSGRAAPVRVVWNCPRRSETRANTAPQAGPLRIIYQGSISRDRVPLTLVAALAQIPDAELLLVGYETLGAVGYLGEIQREAARLGVAERLRVIGAIPRNRLLETTAGCHVGLSLLPMDPHDPNEATMVGSSNKAFEYLACGVPLIVSDRAEWRESFVAAGLAQACDPARPESIAAAMRWYLDRRGEVDEIARRGRARIQSDWNYEAQFAPLLPALLAPA